MRAYIANLSLCKPPSSLPVRAGSVCRCHEHGTTPISQTAMARRIKADRKVRQRKSDGRMVYMGIKLQV